MLASPNQGYFEDLGDPEEGYKIYLRSMHIGLHVSPTDSGLAPTGVESEINAIVFFIRSLMLPVSHFDITNP